MLIKKSFALAIGQIVNRILSLLFIYLLSHNSNNANVYTSSYLVFSLFNDLATIGLIPGTSKIVSEEKELEGFLYFGRRLTLFIGIVFFLIYIILLKPTQSITLNSDYLGAIIAGISLLITPRYFFNRGVIQGQMKMYYSAISLMIEAFIRVIVIIIAINLSSEYIEYVALFSNFLSILCGNLILRLSIHIKPIRMKGYLIKYFNVCLPYGMLTLFFTLYQAVDVFTLKRSLGESINIDLIASAYLYQANRLIYLPIMIASSFAASLIPSLNDNKENTLINIFNYLFPILILFTGVYFLYAKDIFNIIYPDNFLGAEILKSMSLLILILGFYKVLLGVVHSIGNVGVMVCTTWIAFVFKYVLNIILIPKLGYQGALISTIISALFCIIFGIIIVYRNRIKLVRIVLPSLVKYSLLFILSIIIGSLFNIFFSLSLGLLYKFIIEISLLSFVYVALIVCSILWKFNK